MITVADTITQMGTPLNLLVLLLITIHHSLLNQIDKSRNLA